MKRLLVLVALLCPAGIAPAAVLQDFQGSWAGTGQVVTDPVNPTNQVLKLVGGDGPDSGTEHDILQIPIPSGTYGTVTMDVYDFGATVHDTGGPNFLSDNGPRWGIVGDSGNGGAHDFGIAAGILNKSYLHANQGYAMAIEGPSLLQNAWTDDWDDPNFFGHPRRVKTEFPGDLPFSGDGLQLIGTGTALAPEVPGIGAWTTWVFNVDATGAVSITAKRNDVDAPYNDDTVTTYTDFDFFPAVTSPLNIGALTEIWISGGPDNAAGPLQGQAMLGVHGVLVDNITFEGPAAVQLPGDYNGDDAVDAADYVVWRKNLNTNFDLNGNGDEIGASAGTVDQADYDFWRSHFGDALTGSGGATTVPEPSGLALILVAAVVMSSFSARRRVVTSREFDLICVR